MKQLLAHHIILLLASMLIACNATLYVPSSSEPIEQNKLLAGRNLYVQKCSNCHNLFLPERFTDEKWNSKLDTMQVRAKINNNERELIYHYIISHPKK